MSQGLGEREFVNLLAAIAGERKRAFRIRAAMIIKRREKNNRGSLKYALSLSLSLARWKTKGRKDFLPLTVRAVQIKVDRRPSKGNPRIDASLERRRGTSFSPLFLSLYLILPPFLYLCILLALFESSLCKLMRFFSLKRVALTQYQSLSLSLSHDTDFFPLRRSFISRVLMSPPTPRRLRPRSLYTSVGSYTQGLAASIEDQLAIDVTEIRSQSNGRSFFSVLQCTVVLLLFFLTLRRMLYYLLSISLFHAQWLL